MTDEQIALARRAVACSGFRWLPGMLFVKENGTRIRFVVELGTHAIGTVQGGGHPSWREPLPMVGVLPDLTDHATLGCLLALVREAWGYPTLSPSEGLNSGWEVWLWNGPSRLVRGRGTTEAEALVAALEAAP